MSDYTTTTTKVLHQRLMISLQNLFDFTEQMCDEPYVNVFSGGSIPTKMTLKTMKKNKSYGCDVCNLEGEPDPWVEFCCFPLHKDYDVSVSPPQPMNVWCR